MAHFRRTQIAARILAVALIALLSSALGSCSVLDDSGSDAGSGQRLTLAGSVYGPATLDPALVRDVESAFLARQIFRGLVSLDESLQPQPELARTIEVSPDGMTYRFFLYDTGTFHDGSPIDADAVVSSCTRASDPALAGGDGSALPAATYFADIEGIDERLSGQSSTISGVTAVDRWTVEIRLRRPAVNFLAKLAGSPAAIVDARSATGSDWWHTANGSGPFAVETYLADERLDLTAFANYSAGPARLDEVTILFGTDALQPMNLYEAGRIGMTDVPWWAVDRLLSPTDPLHPDLVQTARLSTTFIALNPNFEPFANPDARRMILLGIDREKLVEVMHAGRVQLAEGLIAPGVLDARWPAQIPEYNLAEARDLADHIGSLQLPMTLVEPGSGVSVTVQTVLERDLGVNVAVVDQPWPEFSKCLSGRGLPGFVLTWVADYPDPENMLASLLRTGSPDNYIGYSNPAFDRLVDEANAEMDVELRRELYLRAQQIAIDDAVIIPLYHEMSFTLVQPWVRGLVVTEIGVLALEDVWIED